MEGQQPPAPTSYVCSPCGKIFTGDDCVQQYYDHVCPTTGFNPTDPRHLGADFEQISKAALERGAASQAAGDTTPQATGEQYNADISAPS